MSAPVTEIDKRIGLNLKEVRTLKRISQHQLATLSGISQKMIKDYEIGVSRMAGAQIWRLAEALKTTPSAFFKGLREADIDPITQALNDNNRESLELLKAYFAIEDPKMRKKVQNAVRALRD